MFRRLASVLFVAVLVAPLSAALLAVPAFQASGGKDTVVKAADITPKIFPERVFYRGQVAPVQMRNTGGVHFADDRYLLAGLVDVSGYSSGVREKYKGYLLNEVRVDINNQALAPGAYGIGFVDGPKFIVTDLGSNNVIEAAANKDADLKGPVPLQIVDGSEAGTYRLYLGREYVTIKRTK